MKTNYNAPKAVEIVLTPEVCLLAASQKLGRSFGEDLIEDEEYNAW